MAMNDYPKRVWDNMIPLSVGDTLPKAFEEWSFTEACSLQGTVRP